MQSNLKIMDEINNLFVDSYNRPKKKPLHETVIQIALEDKYDHKRTSYVLRHLEKQKRISSIKLNIDNVGNARFFFFEKATSRKNHDETIKKILRYSYWIKRYSDYSVTKMLGDHLHAIVKAELRAQGFTILSEFSNTFNGKKWDGKETLDIIAEHQGNDLRIGVEIKNMLSLIPSSEVSVKIRMCSVLGIKPVFACRWAEPYKQKVRKSKGFVWQFKNQLYPVGQEKFVKELRKKFNFPIEVKSELPQNNISDFQKWVKIA